MEKTAVCTTARLCLQRLARTAVLQLKDLWVSEAWAAMEQGQTWPDIDRNLSWWNHWCWRKRFLLKNVLICGMRRFLILWFQLMKDQVNRTETWLLVWSHEWSFLLAGIKPQWSSSFLSKCQTCSFCGIKKDKDERMHWIVLSSLTGVQVDLSTTKDWGGRELRGETWGSERTTGLWGNTGENPYWSTDQKSNLEVGYHEETAERVWRSRSIWML